MHLIEMLAICIFGDIDAGGFGIHHNLCEVTGVNFELFHMSVDELRNSKFVSCLHELSDNDRVRLHFLMQRYWRLQRKEFIQSIIRIRSIIL